MIFNCGMISSSKDRFVNVVVPLILFGFVSGWMLFLASIFNPAPRYIISEALYRYDGKPPEQAEAAGWYANDNSYKGEGVSVVLYYGASPIRWPRACFANGNNFYRDAKSVTLVRDNENAPFRYRINVASCDQALAALQEIIDSQPKSDQWISNIAIIEHGAPAAPSLAGESIPFRFLEFLKRYQGTGDHHSQLYLMECSIAGFDRGKTYCIDLARDLNYTVWASREPVSEHHMPLIAFGSNGEIPRPDETKKP